MSLIYEALKKLEREKRVPGSGFTVVARSTWPERRTARLPLVLGGLALLATGLLLGRWLTAPQPATELSAGSIVETPQVRAPSGASVAPPSTQLAEQAVLPEPAAARTETVRPSPSTATAAMPPGPARPPRHEAPAPPPPLALEAIALRDGVPVAIISGRLVREGDLVGEALVVRIGSDHVELEVAGERRVLGF